MPNDSWDVIVVGAGSSGAAFAARSAQKGKRVLRLEAGPDYRSSEMHEAWRSPNPVVALMNPAAAEGMVWADLNASRTEKQQMAPYWRGRGAGGSSSINGQIAIRPPMEDFDDWAKLGCSEWAPQDVLPYFAKLEDDEDFGDESYHCRGGPTPIYRRPQSRWGAVDSALSESALASGHQWSPDVNAPDAKSVSPYPINSRNGHRVSTNDAHLEGARHLTNFTVRGDALVDRVIFEDNRAVGVSFLVDAQAMVEHADTVVLSAGAIHSPGDSHAIRYRPGTAPALPRHRDASRSPRGTRPAGPSDGHDHAASAEVCPHQDAP